MVDAVPFTVLTLAQQDKHWKKDDRGDYHFPIELMFPVFISIFQKCNWRKF
jgi:hypothetical protein